ncbi:MAG: beta strand repeat-containing protein [Phycisphaerae bacterium]
MHTTLRRCARIASAVALATATTAAFASTSETWDGSNNNPWSAAAHWSPAAVPNNGSPAGVTYAVTINAGSVNLDINATIDSLSLTNSTLNDDFGNSLTVLGATTIHNAALQFGTPTATGAHGSFASVDNFGTFTTGNFTGGNNTVSTSGTFTNEAGAFTLLSAPGDVANFNALTNLGRLEINLSTTLNITGGGNGVTDVPQNSQFQVAGDFNVINGGTPSSAVGHLATIEGDIQFANHVIADTSAITISNTGALELNGNQTFSAPAVANSGSINIGNFAPGNNTLTITGTYTNTASGVLRIVQSGDVVNVNALVNQGVIIINPNETFNITGGGNGVTDAVQGSTFAVGGNFNVINGNVTSSAFGHLASIEGDVRLGNGPANSIADAANLSISNTGALELTGNQTFSTPNLTNAGAINLGNFSPGNNTLTVPGTLTNAPSGVLRIVQSGDVVNVNSLVNQGVILINPGETLNVTGGGNGVTDVVQGSTIVNQGAFNVINGNVTSSAFLHLASIEGDLRLGSAPIADAAVTLTISNTGALELIGNQTFSVDNLNNAGSVNLGNFTPGNNTLTIAGVYNNQVNSALRLVQSGDVVNINAFNNLGFVQVNAGETLNITGGGNGLTDVLQGSTFVLAGTFNVINGNTTTSALAKLSSIEGDLRIATAPIADSSNVSISNTGALELNGNQTFSTPNIFNNGSVNIGNFAPGNNTLTVPGLFHNGPNAALRLVQSGDVVNVGTLDNNGFIQVGSGETLNITGGGPGITNIVAGSTILLGGSINVINSNVSTNGLLNLATVAGTFELLNSQTLTVGNVSIATTGQLFLGNASTLIAGNITNSGFLASSSFTPTGNSLTVTGTLTNNPGATFNINSGDTTTIGNLNNAGTVNINFNYTLPLLTGGTGSVYLSANGTVLTLSGGTSQNTIHDNNQFGVSGTLISNNSVQTGPLQLANVTINGHHKIALPGSKIKNLALQGSSGNWTSGLDLAPFAKTILEDSLTHNTTLARTLDQVNFGRTHANGIYSSALAANQRLVLIDNAAIPIPFSSFGGQPADAGSILLMPTYLGDANLDSKVDLSDLSTVLNHFGVATSSWLDGNFDGAATVNLTDLSDVLNNFGLNGGVGPNLAAPTAPAPAPEPASLALLVLAFPALFKRRR